MVLRARFSIIQFIFTITIHIQLILCFSNSVRKRYARKTEKHEQVIIQSTDSQQNQAASSIVNENEKAPRTEHRPNH